MRGNLGATDQTATIGPKASETARELLSIAESMLGGRLSQAGIRPQEEAVRQYILSQYPLLGRAPTRQEIVAALGLRSADELQRILERLHSIDSLYLDHASREIRLAYPFSTVPTKHVVRFPDWDEAKPVYAQCAVDALGIPFMVGHNASIGSSCAHCGGPIAIEVLDGAIVAYQPAETVVWVGTSRSDHAATSCCPTMNFFCSSPHVQAWRQPQPDPTGHELNLGEALYLGKGIFEDLLKVHSRTELSTRTRPQSHDQR